MVLLVALDHWKVDKDDAMSAVDTPLMGMGGFGLGSGSGSGSFSAGFGGQQVGSMFGESAPKKDENAFRYFISKLVSIVDLPC